MTFRPAYPQFIIFIFACILPCAAYSAKEEVIAEKRTAVAMRMIGHEVLKCLGDDQSRILPIEQIDESYKIPFELDFSFNPDDIISVIERVMTETSTATHYLVEVEQCDTKEIVHSFVIGYPGLLPCEGRMLPVACYSLLITILDGPTSGTHASNTAVASSSIDSYSAATADRSASTASETTKLSFFSTAILLFLVLTLIGGMVYLSQKRKLAATDPNVIQIGDSRFDKRNMALFFDDKKVELSHKEAELLSLLHTAANTPVEREVMLQRVWGDEGNYVGRTLDVFISKLRKKLEADSSVKIVNIRGVGYKLVMDVPN